MNPALVQEVQAAYADLNLAGDYNVIEITANQLSDASLRAAIAEAGTTSANDLIVLRTTATQNKITLSGKELAIDFAASSWGAVATRFISSLPFGAAVPGSATKVEG